MHSNQGKKPTQIKVSQSLELVDLVDLLHGKILALRIPNYYPQQESEQISQKLIQQKNLERYHRAPDVGVQRTAITFFETNCCIEKLQDYYDQAGVSIESLRQALFPTISPLDKLKLHLQEMWLAGAHIENVHHRTMLAGIGRVFENNFELPPHQDILARDIEDSPLPPVCCFENLITQLSINIYLRVPQIGGELEIWNSKPSNTEQQEIRDREFKYEGIIDRESLPSATATIKPQAGELILFDSGNIHAVRPCQDGPRASMSMFIGYRGKTKPLTYWS